MPEPRFRNPLKNDTYRVIDGDTVECLLDRGWGETKLTAVRLFGIDAPESTTRQNLLERRAGELVKKVVLKWFSENGNMLYASSESKPKYEGRSVGRIWSGVFENELTYYLSAHGLVRPYFGGTKGEWSDDSLLAIIERAEAILSA